MKRYVLEQRGITKLNGDTISFKSLYSLEKAQKEWENGEKSVLSATSDHYGVFAEDFGLKVERSARGKFSTVLGRNFNSHTERYDNDAEYARSCDIMKKGRNIICWELNFRDKRYRVDSLFLIRNVTAQRKQGRTL